MSLICSLFLDPEIEDARPSSIGEEEMQLQIAIALSKEEHEKIDEMMRSDEVRLQVCFYLSLLSIQHIYLLIMFLLIL